jgi:hypothetical protein
MRILFHVTLTTMLRHFESVVLALADRGHSVRIAWPGRRADLPPPEALAAHERISFAICPATRSDRWGGSIHEMRLLRDYLRYLDGRYKDAPKLRTRAARKLVTGLSHEERDHISAYCPRCNERLLDDEVAYMLRGFGKTGRTNLKKLFALMEDTIASDAGIEAFLRAEQPDVLLVTPLINFGSYQADYVKSGMALGIPTGFPVFSWDNLSNKGVMHVIPDRMFVWNELQRTEAVEMHDVPADRVVVAGAPRFDDFFAMTPATSRAQFCGQHGLDPSQPIVTYLCSSEFVAGREMEFVPLWIDEVRKAPALASCNILVRPHPRERKHWKKFQPGRPRVAVSLPQALNSDQLLFDTLTHSAAVVGLNTSAQLEAGIVGTPVLTILAPEFAEGQQGTLHFQYLLRERGGFVDVAPDFDGHRRQLTAAVEGTVDRARIRSFIQQFLRPQGLDRAVTPLLADAIEDLARTQPVGAGSAAGAHS